jgi:hypothetical protein
MLVEVSFRHFLILLQVAVFALYLIDVLLASLNRRRARAAFAGSLLPSVKWDTAMCIAAAAAAAFFFFTLPDKSYSNDSFDHIGYVRNISAENDLTPSGVLAQPPEVDLSRLKADPRKGAMHPVLAALGVFASIDPAVFWYYLPVILAPIALLGFFFFSVILLPEMFMVVIVLILFLLFQGGIGRDFLAAAAYGHNLSLVFVWSTFVFAFRYAKGGGRPLLLLTILFFATGSAIHVGFLLQFSVILASLVIFGRWLGLKRNALFLLSACCLAAGGLILLAKLAESSTSGNLMHMHRQGLLFLSDNLFIASPVEIARSAGIVFLGGLVLVPGLFFLKRYRDQAMLHLCLSVLPLAIAMNPFIAPVVYEHGSYLLHRFVYVIPSFHIAVLVIASLLTNARSRRRPLTAIAAAIVVFVWADWFLVPSAGAIKSIPKSVRFGMDKSVLPAEFEGAIRTALDKIPEKSVVVSDPVTSYVLSAYADIKVVSTLHQHGDPGDTLVWDRMSVSEEVMSPFVTQRRSLSLLKRYRARYILVNGGIARPIYDYMAAWDPSFMGELWLKFKTMKNLRLVDSSERVMLFEVDDFEPGREVWTPTVPFLQSHEGKFVPCPKPVGLDGVIIEGIDVKPRKVLPGEEVTVSVNYRKNSDSSSHLPLKLVIRFENEELEARFGNYPGSKIVRRTRERMGGYLARFRHDRRVFDGFYPERLWPLGAPVVETFKIKLPSSLLEGEYSVQVKLARETLLPNFRLRDFIRNRDTYTGVPCTGLRVVRTLMR